MNEGISNSCPSTISDAWYVKSVSVQPVLTNSNSLNENISGVDPTLYVWLGIRGAGFNDIGIDEQSMMAAVPVLNKFYTVGV